MDNGTIEDMHFNGVHTHCRYAPRSAKSGSWRKCYLAGKVERVHGHDFDGPLWASCGCDDFTTATFAS